MHKWIFFLVAALLLLYSVSLGHNFLFDEENVILRNPYLRSFENIPQVFSKSFFQLSGSENIFLPYYRPLSVLSFMVDYHFWKTDPFGYNLTSLAFHMMLVVFFFLLAHRMLGSALAAFFAALFFAVHPIHTEALGHVSCRSETLGALFLVLAVWSYLRKIPIAAVFFQILGLLSKESFILLPLFLASADLCFLNGTAAMRLKRLAPYAALSGLYGVLRASGYPVPMVLPDEPFASVLLRIGSMGPALLRYAQTLIWPPHFQLFGSIAFAERLTEPKVLFTAFWAALMVFGMVDAWKRRSKTSFFALTLLVGGLIPYVQSKHFYPEWAEHFLTVPALGFALILGLWVRRFESFFGSKTKLALAMLPFAVWCAALSYRTYERNRLYNYLTVYYGQLSQSGSPYAVHGDQGLAKFAMADGRWQEAEEHLWRALKKEINADVTLGLLGSCMMNQKKYEEAKDYFEAASELQPELPAYRVSAAGALMKLEQYSDAAEVYRGLIINNGHDYSLVRLGMAALELDGKPKEARRLGRVFLKRHAEKKFESAVIATALMRLSYRQKWKNLFRAEALLFAAAYSEVPWHGLALRAWAGRIAPSEYRELAENRFPEFKDAALLNAALAASAVGNSVDAQKILADYQSLLKDGPDPLERREMDRILNGGW